MQCMGGRTMGRIYNQKLCFHTPLYLFPCMVARILEIFPRYCFRTRPTVLHCQAPYTYAWHNKLFLALAQLGICLAQPAICKRKVVGWHSQLYAWHSRLYVKAKLWVGTAGYMLGTAGYMVVACEIILSALGLFRFSILDSQSQVPVPVA